MVGGVGVRDGGGVGVVRWGGTYWVCMSCIQSICLLVNEVVS